MRVDFAHDAAGISDGDNIGGNVFCHDTACSRSSGRIGCPAVAIVTFLLTYQLFFGLRTVSSDCNRTAYPDKRPVMTFAEATAA